MQVLMEKLSISYLYTSVDDILIRSTNEVEHKQPPQQDLQASVRQWEANFTINLQKSEFYEETSLEILSPGQGSSIKPEIQLITDASTYIGAVLLVQNSATTATTTEGSWSPSKSYAILMKACALCSSLTTNHLVYWKKKTPDSPRQQQALSYLSEVTKT